MSDPRVVLAREAHRLAGEHDVQAAQHRETRNRIIRQLRAEDPGRWTYTALAKAVGISAELVAAIAKGRVPRRTARSAT